ncbi:MAG TPA: hypothetical protein DCO79_12120 [Spirochaeta sp.]|nr:hypothetical protein [Spirochaeta sp.]
MKNVIKLFLIILLFSASFEVFSQSSEDVEHQLLLEFEFKAALSLPSYFWLEDNSWNSLTMFTIQGAAWAGAAVNVSEDFAIVFEAGYNGKGASLDASDGSLKWRFHYLEFPVWVKKSFSVGTNSAWLGAGGYYGYCLGGTYNFNVPGTEWNSRGNMSIGDEELITEMRRHDAGLLFSAGSRQGRLLYEIRFPISVIPALSFTPEDEINYGGYRRALNSGFLIAVGYSF